MVFIDAVEPKNIVPDSTDPNEPRFPDTIEVSYSISTNFKENIAADKKDGRATVGDHASDYHSAGAGADDRVRWHRVVALCSEQGKLFHERASPPYFWH